MTKFDYHILEVVGDYLPVRDTPDGHRGGCPFHDDHGQALRVDPMTGTYACTVCGVSGDAVGFVASYNRISRRWAAEILTERFP